MIKNNHSNNNQNDNINNDIIIIITHHHNRNSNIQFTLVLLPHLYNLSSSSSHTYHHTSTAPYSGVVTTFIKPIFSLLSYLPPHFHCSLHWCYHHIYTTYLLPPLILTTTLPLLPTLVLSPHLYNLSSSSSHTYHHTSTAPYIGVITTFIQPIFFLLSYLPPHFHCSLHWCYHHIYTTYLLPPLILTTTLPLLPTLVLSPHLYNLSSSSSHTYHHTSTAPYIGVVTTFIQPIFFLLSYLPPHFHCSLHWCCHHIYTTYLLPPLILTTTLPLLPTLVLSPHLYNLSSSSYHTYHHTSTAPYIGVITTFIQPIFFLLSYLPPHFHCSLHWCCHHIYTTYLLPPLILTTTLPLLPTLVLSPHLYNLSSPSSHTYHHTSTAPYIGVITTFIQPIFFLLSYLPPHFHCSLHWCYHHIYTTYLLPPLILTTTLPLLPTLVLSPHLYNLSSSSSHTYHHTSTAPYIGVVTTFIQPIFSLLSYLPPHFHCSLHWCYHHIYTTYLLPPLILTTTLPLLPTLVLSPHLYNLSSPSSHTYHHTSTAPYIGVITTFIQPIFFLLSYLPPHFHCSLHWCYHHIYTTYLLPPLILTTTLPLLPTLVLSPHLYNLSSSSSHTYHHTSTAPYIGVITTFIQPIFFLLSYLPPHFHCSLHWCYHHIYTTYLLPPLILTTTLPLLPTLVLSPHLYNLSSSSSHTYHHTSTAPYIGVITTFIQPIFSLLSYLPPHFHCSLHWCYHHIYTTYLLPPLILTTTLPLLPTLVLSPHLYNLSSSSSHTYHHTSTAPYIGVITTFIQPIFFLLSYLPPHFHCSLHWCYHHIYTTYLLPPLILTTTLPLLPTLVLSPHLYNLSSSSSHTYHHTSTAPYIGVITTFIQPIFFLLSYLPPHFHCSLHWCYHHIYTTYLLPPLILTTTLPLLPTLVLSPHLYNLSSSSSHTYHHTSTAPYIGVITTFIQPIFFLLSYLPPHFHCSLHWCCHHIYTTYLLPPLILTTTLPLLPTLVLSPHLYNLSSSSSHTYHHTSTAPYIGVVTTFIQPIFSLLSYLPPHFHCSLQWCYHHIYTTYLLPPLILTTTLPLLPTLVLSPHLYNLSSSSSHTYHHTSTAPYIGVITTFIQPIFFLLSYLPPHFHCSLHWCYHHIYTTYLLPPLILTTTLPLLPTLVLSPHLYNLSSPSSHTYHHTSTAPYIGVITTFIQPIFFLLSYLPPHFHCSLHWCYHHIYTTYLLPPLILTTTLPLLPTVVLSPHFTTYLLPPLILTTTLPLLPTLVLSPHLYNLSSSSSHTYHHTSTAPYIGVVTTFIQPIFSLLSYLPPHFHCSLHWCYHHIYTTYLLPPLILTTTLPLLPTLVLSPHLYNLSSSSSHTYHHTSTAPYIGVITTFIQPIFFLLSYLPPHFHCSLHWCYHHIYTTYLLPPLILTTTLPLLPTVVLSPHFTTYLLPPLILTTTLPLLPTLVLSPHLYNLSSSSSHTYHHTSTAPYIGVVTTFIQPIFSLLSYLQPHFHCSLHWCYHHIYTTYLLPPLILTTTLPLLPTLVLSPHLYNLSSSSSHTYHHTSTAPYIGVITTFIQPIFFLLSYLPPHFHCSLHWCYHHIYTTYLLPPLILTTTLPLLPTLVLSPHLYNLSSSSSHTYHHTSTAPYIGVVTTFIQPIFFLLSYLPPHFHCSLHWCCHHIYTTYLLPPLILTTTLPLLPTLVLSPHLYNLSSSSSHTYHHTSTAPYSGVVTTFYNLSSPSSHTYHHTSTAPYIGVITTFIQPIFFLLSYLPPHFHCSLHWCCHHIYTTYLLPPLILTTTLPLLPTLVLSPHLYNLSSSSSHTYHHTSTAPYIGVITTFIQPIFFLLSYLPPHFHCSLHWCYHHIYTTYLLPPLILTTTLPLLPTLVLSPHLYNLSSSSSHTYHHTSTAPYIGVITTFIQPIFSLLSYLPPHFHCSLHWCYHHIYTTYLLPPLILTTTLPLLPTLVLSPHLYNLSSSSSHTYHHTSTAPYIGVITTFIQPIFFLLSYLPPHFHCSLHWCYHHIYTTYLLPPLILTTTLPLLPTLVLSPHLYNLSSSSSHTYHHTSTAPYIGVITTFIQPIFFLLSYLPPHFHCSLHWCYHHIYTTYLLPPLILTTTLPLLPTLVLSPHLYNLSSSSSHTYHHTSTAPYIGVITTFIQPIFFLLSYLPPHFHCSLHWCYHHIYTTYLLPPLILTTTLPLLPTLVLSPHLYNLSSSSSHTYHHTSTAPYIGVITTFIQPIFSLLSYLPPHFHCSLHWCYHHIYTTYLLPPLILTTTLPLLPTLVLSPHLYNLSSSSSHTYHHTSTAPYIGVVTTFIQPIFSLLSYLPPHFHCSLHWCYHHIYTTYLLPPLILTTTLPLLPTLVLSPHLYNLSSSSSHTYHHTSTAPYIGVITTFIQPIFFLLSYLPPHFHCSLHWCYHHIYTTYLLPPLILTTTLPLLPTLVLSPHLYNLSSSSSHTYHHTSTAPYIGVITTFIQPIFFLLSYLPPHFHCSLHWCYHHIYTTYLLPPLILTTTLPLLPTLVLSPHLYNLSSPSSHTYHHTSTAPYIGVITTFIQPIFFLLSYLPPHFHCSLHWCYHHIYTTYLLPPLILTTTLPLLPTLVLSPHLYNLSSYSSHTYHHTSTAPYIGVITTFIQPIFFLLSYLPPHFHCSLHWCYHHIYTTYLLPPLILTTTLPLLPTLVLSPHLYNLSSSSSHTYHHTSTAPYIGVVTTFIQPIFFLLSYLPPHFHCSLHWCYHHIYTTYLLPPLILTTTLPLLPTLVLSPHLYNLSSSSSHTYHHTSTAPYIGVITTFIQPIFFLLSYLPPHFHCSLHWCCHHIYTTYLLPPLILTTTLPLLPTLVLSPHLYNLSSSSSHTYHHTSTAPYIGVITTFIQPIFFLLSYLPPHFHCSLHWCYHHIYTTYLLPPLILTTTLPLLPTLVLSPHLYNLSSSSSHTYHHTSTAPYIGVITTFIQPIFFLLSYLPPHFHCSLQWCCHHIYTTYLLPPLILTTTLPLLPTLVLSPHLYNLSSSSSHTYHHTSTAPYIGVITTFIQPIFFLLSYLPPHFHCSLHWCYHHIYTTYLLPPLILTTTLPLLPTLVLSPHLYNLSSSSSHTYHHTSTAPYIGVITTFIQPIFFLLSYLPPHFHCSLHWCCHHIYTTYLLPPLILTTTLPLLPTLVLSPHLYNLSSSSSHTYHHTSTAPYIGVITTFIQPIFFLLSYLPPHFHCSLHWCYHHIYTTYLLPPLILTTALPLLPTVVLSPHLYNLSSPSSHTYHHTSTAPYIGVITTFIQPIFFLLSYLPPHFHCSLHWCYHHIYTTYLLPPLILTTTLPLLPTLVLSPHLYNLSSSSSHTYHHTSTAPYIGVVTTFIQPIFSLLSYLPPHFHCSLHWCYHHIYTTYLLPPLILTTTLPLLPTFHLTIMCHPTPTPVNLTPS